MRHNRAARLGAATEAHRQRPLSGAAAKNTDRDMPWSEQKRKEALARAAEVGPLQTGRELGISFHTIRRWQEKQRRDGEAILAMPEVQRAVIEDRAIEVLGKALDEAGVTGEERERALDAARGATARLQAGAHRHVRSTPDPMRSEWDSLPDEVKQRRPDLRWGRSR